MLKFVFPNMTNTMNYLDLIGEDCMEIVINSMFYQMEHDIDNVVANLIKFAEMKYDKETKVNNNKFNMVRFKLAIANKLLKSV